MTCKAENTAMSLLFDSTHDIRNENCTCFYDDVVAEEDVVTETELEVARKAVEKVYNEARVDPDRWQSLEENLVYDTAYDAAYDAVYDKLKADYPPFVVEDESAQIAAQVMSVVDEYDLILNKWDNGDSGFIRDEE